MLRTLFHQARIRHALRGKLGSKLPVYLCSYPKSGRTWLRFVVGNYLNLAYELGVEVDFDSLFTLLPNLSTNLRRGVDAYHYAEDERVPLLLSSHSRYSAAEFNAKSSNGDIVFLLRGIHDVLVSSFFHATHQRRQSGRFKGDLKAYLRDPAAGVADYIAYQNSWADELDRRHCLVVSYEGLTDDGSAVLRATLEFLAVPVDAALIDRAIELSAFERMRETELEKGIGGLDHDRSDPDALRVRRGKIGGYRDYLDSDDLAYVKASCERGLSDAASRLLAKYGVGADERA